MECELYKEYQDINYTLIMGKILRLEVADDVVTSNGGLDLEKARPLMMTGSNKGMHFSTVMNIDHYESFSSMFADGKDPLSKKYNASQKEKIYEPCA